MIDCYLVDRIDLVEDVETRSYSHGRQGSTRIIYGTDLNRNRLIKPMVVKTDEATIIMTSKKTLCSANITQQEQKIVSMMPPLACSHDLS